MGVLEGNENKLKTTPNDRWVASAVILSFIWSEVGAVLKVCDLPTSSETAGEENLLSNTHIRRGNGGWSWLRCRRLYSGEAAVHRMGTRQLDLT